MVKSLIASEHMLDHELTGHLGSVGVRIRSLGQRSCTVEHLKQVRVSSDMKLVVRWEGSSHTITVRVLRSRMGMIVKGGTGYHTTVELVAVPDELKSLIARFVESRTGTSTGAGHGDGRGIQA